MKDKDEALQLRTQWFAAAKEQTLESLPEFLQKLTASEHDYNTICYAVAAGAVAAAWAMDRTPNGGITGFQAGAIMWEFIQEWSHISPPAWILKAEDMLYPQNEYKFTTISAQLWAWIQEQANQRKQQDTGFEPHPDVIAHWKAIQSGAVPFGFKIHR